MNRTECQTLRDSLVWRDAQVLGTLAGLSFIALIVTVGNTLVVAAVFNSSKLRSPTNTFIVSLAVSDLMVGVAVLPFSATWEVFKTHKMLQNAYGDQCLGRTQCYDWFKRFKDGRESVDDDPRSGRPSTSTDDAHVTKVNEIVRSMAMMLRQKSNHHSGLVNGYFRLFRVAQFYTFQESLCLRNQKLDLCGGVYVRSESSASRLLGMSRLSSSSAYWKLSVINWLTESSVPHEFHIGFSSFTMGYSCVRRV
ncbi:hypothetical protein QTP88_003392 [Uroleucon formosanum]